MNSTIAKRMMHVEPEGEVSFQITLGDLAKANDADLDLAADLAKLKKNESLRVGGGAAQLFVVTRVS